jgi:hypothetical protein
MPSKSPAQHRLMEAVAHNPKFAKTVGIPVSVGQDFSAADRGRRFADGGSVLTGSLPPGSRASAAAAAPGFLGALGGLSDLLTGAARGAATTALGWPGDLEQMLSGLLPENRTLSSTVTDAQPPRTVLPTSADVSGWLPPATSFSGPHTAQIGSELGNWAPVSPGQLGKVGRAGIDALSGLGAEALRRGVEEGRGPLSALQATLAPSYAVKPRGGNFFPYDIGRYLGNEQLRVPNTPFDPPSGTHANMGDWVPEGQPDPVGRAAPVADWAKKQLANYLRKDLGSPTDPLLQVEKEYPSLHLPDETLAPDSEAAIQSERINRMQGAEVPFGASPTTLRYAKAAKQHFDLTGDPLTPWGYHSTIGGDLRNPLMSSESPQSLLGGNLGEELDFGSRADELGAGPYAQPADYTDPAYLKTFLAHPDNEQFRQFGWMADAPPDTKVWRLADTGDDPLGFGHVLDYLGEATEAHNDIKYQNGPETLRAMLDRNPGMNIRPEWRRALALHDAGLTLDPASLGRLSVADAVRKTAQWNAHLAEQGAPTNADLARGISAVHKDYGDGMKWVELGQPELPPLTELPDGYRVEDMGPAGTSPKTRYHVIGPNGSYASGPTPSMATGIGLKQLNSDRAAAELSAGLNAEGQAMGHCVGGYCDQVSERGTKIFSLRDKSNNPHVTVEVRPNQTADRAFQADDGSYEQLMRTLEEQLQTRPSQNPGGPPTSEYMLPHRGSNVGPRTALHDWMDATSELADHGAAMNWLKTNHPDLHAQFNTESPVNDIVQIKGKQNAAPVAKYLPYVQDFVKSGNWGRVGDLGNTGLTATSTLPPSLLARTPDLGKYATDEELWNAVKAHPRYDQIVKEGQLRGGFAQGSAGHGILNQVGNPSDLLHFMETSPYFGRPAFAHGGSVAAATPVVGSRFEALLDRLNKKV